jgi:REP element-mobilizing transposase RayT
MSKREFNSDEPIAYFITWTSYGTWLPGDERGWWRKGGDWHAANDLFREMAAVEMKETLFTLSKDDRDVVEHTVAKHCEIRGWTLHAAQARTNHVHVVVTALGYKPETVSDQFKPWCTRKLKPSHPGRERFWTEGASRRWINHEDDLEAAIIYVNEAQDRKGSEIQARRASE